MPANGPCGGYWPRSKTSWNCDAPRASLGDPAVRGALMGELEDQLDAFDHAWQGNPPPRLEDYYPPPSQQGNQASPAARQKLLEELIKIELGHRWRLAAGPTAGAWCQPPRLEDYAARFPELRQGTGLTAELVVEEYRARCLWGHRPNHAEFVNRFPQFGPTLCTLLQKIDAEL